MATDILTQLANPETMKALSFSDKMEAGLLVTVLGMGITFLALVALLVVIGMLAKLSTKTSKKHLPVTPVPAVDEVVDDPPLGKKGEDELLAVISAAVAMTMQRSSGDIRIRNIRKVEEPSPSWNRAGILEQMNTRL